MLVRHLLGHRHRELVNDAVNEHRGVGLAEDEVGVVFEPAFDVVFCFGSDSFARRSTVAAIERRVSAASNTTGISVVLGCIGFASHRDAGDQILLQQLDGTAEVGARSPE